MHFLRVNVTSYDAVNMIHDVIRPANIFPYTAIFMFVGVKPWSHRANGRVTDKNSFYPFISVLCSFLIR